MKSKNSLGFTVIELLITLIVVGVVFLSFTITYTGVQNITKKSTDIAVAGQIGFAKLQEYENLNFTTLQNAPYNTATGVLTKITTDSYNFTASLPSVLENPRSGEVWITTFSPTLKQVIVKVIFGSGPSQRYIEYDTFIQKSGVGR